MLNKNFLSGNYQKVIAWSLDHSEDSSEVPSLVGALSFSGKLLEAKKTYKEAFPSLDDSEKSACRFFLGLAYTRKSQYKNASKIFRSNLKSLHKESTPLQRFYVYQGVAFYLFFIGRLHLSMKWTLKSFDAAMDAKDLYARSLSTDLLAHLKLRLGEINVGLDLLKTADQLSLKIGNKTFGNAIEIVELQYLAQYGYDRKNILSILEKRFDSLVSEDNYSRAAIGLELARQYTLRGQYHLSEKILEIISSHIFATENRRQEIQLNLRFAENFFQMGKLALARNYLRTARRCLNFEADKSFEIQIMGFEYKLSEGSEKETIGLELESKSRLFNSIINDNILSRAHLTAKASFNREDLYHDFLLSLENTNEKIPKIIESGYWSLLAKELNLSKGETLFYFDPEALHVILFSADRVDVPLTHLTPTDARLLLAILGGAKKKADICKKIWGYDYDPLRHDNIIYTAVRSLRKNLGSGGTWIETTEHGYHFSADRKFKINLKEHDVAVADKKADESLLVGESLENFPSDLNLRQIKSLKYLKQNESIDVGTYLKMFDVSDVTASRDLRALKKLGFVITIGQARATKYLLARK
jgi:hypothetical protein